jgi:hypothetical protein
MRAPENPRRRPTPTSTTSGAASPGTSSELRSRRAAPDPAGFRMTHAARFRPFISFSRQKKNLITMHLSRRIMVATLITMKKYLTTHRRSTLLQTAVATAVATAVLYSSAPAATLYWDTNADTAGSGNADGDWNAGTNWSTFADGDIAPSA